MPRQPPCRRLRSPMPAPQGKRRAQKKQGNFRVFCNDTTPPSRCGRGATTRRQQSRECTPGCPLAEKKFRDRVRFRHRTSANAQKCANFFASCARRDARDASRAASPRRGASRHCDATCTHVATAPQRRPPPSSASTPSRHRHLRAVASTDTDRTGGRLAPAHTSQARNDDVRDAHHVAAACSSPPHTALMPRRTRTASENRRRRRAGQRTSPRAATRCARGATGDSLTPSSHRRTPRRQRHELPQRPYGNADDVVAAQGPKRNRPHEAAGSGVATGDRLSGRRPRAVRRIRPATAVRSTARRRPLPAPGSSLRRRHLR